MVLSKNKFAVNLFHLKIFTLHEDQTQTLKNTCASTHKTAYQ